MAAEPFLSYVPGRRAEWKGHETAKNVRNVIRCNEGQPLRLFVLVDPLASVDEDGDKSEDTAYVEVAPAYWPDYFREEV